MNQEGHSKVYEYWLAGITELSDKKKIRLCGYMKDIKQAYYIEETELRQIEFLNEADCNTIMQAQKNNPEEAYLKMCEKEIQMTTYGSRDYPATLRDLADPPYALFWKGNLPDPEKPGVAIVGARQCTPYGEEYARIFAEKLAQCGVEIISGLARGIDGSGHRGALLGGGATYAVLGNGVDICYPREHIGLYMDILEKGGGILSEVVPGTQPLPFLFPKRNRIISGLAKAILVMEAKEKSGSLITADSALEQGKDVYALPGPLTSALSAGCNRLIWQGAGILLSPEQLMEELHLQQSDFCKIKAENKKMLETEEELLYSCVGIYPKSLSQLTEETQLPVWKVMSLLIALEMKGFAKEVSKNYYIKSVQ